MRKDLLDDLELDQGTGGNRWGLYPSEIMDMMEDREVWRFHLELLPSQPSRKSGQ